MTTLYGTATIEVHDQPNGMPDLAVEIYTDDWTDITSYVRLSSDIAIRRGRNSVLETIGASTLSLTLDNVTNAFSPGYPGAAFAGYIVPNLRIRVRADVSYWRTIFDGYIDSWTPNPDDGTCAVVATDLFRMLSRSTMSDVGTETVRASSTSASTWWLNIASGGACSDAFGNRGATGIYRAKANLQNGSAGTLTYGTAGPTNMPNGLTLTPGITTQLVVSGYDIDHDSGGPVVVLPPSVDLTLGGANEWSLGVWINVTEFYDRLADSGWAKRYTCQVWGVTNWTGWSVWLEGSTPSAMSLRFMDHAGTYITDHVVGDIRNTGWHHVLVQWDGADIYMGWDGTAADNGTPGDDTAPVQLCLGGMVDPARGYRVWNHGTLSVASIAYDAHMGDRSDWAIAGLTGFAGETASERAGRIRTAAGVTSFSTLYVAGTEESPMGAWDPTGADPLAQLQDTAQAEHGIVFVDPYDGSLNFYNRAYRGTSSTPALTLDEAADIIGSDFSNVIEDAKIVNSVTVTAADNLSYTATDAASIATNGRLSVADTVNVQTVTDAVQHAHWYLSNYATARPRIATITVDALTSPNPNILQGLAELDFGDRVRVTNLPDGIGAASRLEGFVEGITWAISSSQVTATLDLSPATPAEMVVSETNYSRLAPDAGTVPTADLSSGATSVTMTTGSSGWTTTDAPFDLALDDETVTVTAVTGSTLTITRAQRGTTAAAHTAATCAVAFPDELGLGF